MILQRSSLKLIINVIQFDTCTTKIHFNLHFPKPILCNVLKELCAIRDNITTCDIASITDIIAMIEDICIN